jgi:hypothetical protein
MALRKVGGLEIGDAVYSFMQGFSIEDWREIMKEATAEAITNPRGVLVDNLEKAQQTAPEPLDGGKALHDTGELRQIVSGARPGKMRLSVQSKQKTARVKIAGMTKFKTKNFGNISYPERLHFPRSRWPKGTTKAQKKAGRKKEVVPGVDFLSAQEGNAEKVLPALAGAIEKKAKSKGWI